MVWPTACRTRGSTHPLWTAVMTHLFTRTFDVLVVALVFTAFM